MFFNSVMITIRLIVFTFAINLWQHVIVTSETVPLVKGKLSIDTVDKAKCPWTSVRLPTFVKPLHYELYLHPNITNYEYKGKTSIFFKLNQATKFILVHSKDLNIEEVGIKLKNKNNKKLNEIKTKKLVYCQDYDLLYIETAKEMSDDQTLLYKLFITYSAKLSEERHEGLYISKYNVSTSSSDIEYKIASTQFEPTSARLAFPCLDEPAFKATFTVKVVHDPDHKVSSNTVIVSTNPYLDGNKDGIDDKHDESEENDDYSNKMSKAENLKVSTFEKTVKMSTYLVAVAVSGFERKEAVSEVGKHTIGVLAPEHQMAKMDYALDVGTKLIDHYESFFGIKYPLSKLDLIAIPGFSASAMENWGLITFELESVLYDESDESISDKENVVIVIGHEMSHQWFGNLVTMQWWDDLWLNEGFATYMSMVGVEALYPDWMSSGQFLSLVTHKSMVGDASRFTHPIQNKIENPDEIFDAFDEITYDKTASLIRYLSVVIGLDNLKAGLRTYMEKYQYSNTVSTNLWQTLGENGSLTLDVEGYDYQIEEIMESWIKAKGYPILDVKVNGDKVVVKQSVYHYYPCLNESASDAEDTKWIIRLDIVTSKEAEKAVSKWIMTKQISVKLPDLADADWIKVNVNSSGYYRVNYDSKNWIALIKMLKSSDGPKISASDRVGLIDDALSFLYSGHMKPAMALQLVTYLEHHEDDLVPWETALHHFGSICSKLKNECDTFRKFVHKLIKPTIGKIGFEDQGTHLQAKLRSTILLAGICLNDSSVTEHFKKKFDEWKKDGKSKLNPNLKLVTISAGIKFGDEEDWNFVWNKFQESKSPAETSVYLTAFGYTNTEKFVNKLLDTSVDKSAKLSQKNRIALITSLIKNELITSGKINLWTWYKKNYEKLHTFESQLESGAATGLVKTIASLIDTEEEMDQVVDFLKENKEKDLVINSIKEIIGGNIYWKKMIEPSVVEWLSIYEKKLL